jgi:hypothetical protein
MVPYRLSPRKREKMQGKNIMISCPFTRIGAVHNPKYQAEL